ncbi:tyrosine phosphatase family-domain-containing protein [Phlebopus sp. FC_14]|nr:tyrosine phosphatase family-domain-containing protein [Phlebopus sp. FC_14]
MSLPSPPFVPVEGIINLRSVGGFATSDKGFIMKPLAIFRSGEASSVTELGKQHLCVLGIKKIFDLRSEVELKNYRTEARTIEGIELVWAPITPIETQDQEKLIQSMLSRLSSDWRAFLALYKDSLRIAGPAYELIFAHVRDHPEDTCLVHCTVIHPGNDRTGPFLLNVSDEEIAEEYALTAVGLQLAVAVFAARFEKEAMCRENSQGLGSAQHEAENMRATIEMIRKKGESATDTDIETIRANLLVRGGCVIE